MDKALVFETKDCGFKSRPDHFFHPTKNTHLLPIPPTEALSCNVRGLSNANPIGNARSSFDSTSAILVNLKYFSDCDTEVQYLESIPRSADD